LVLQSIAQCAVIKVMVDDGYPSDWENKAGIFGTISGKIKQGRLEQ